MNAHRLKLLLVGALLAALVPVVVFDVRVMSEHGVLALGVR